jgi:hypothetical protein
MNIRSGSVPAFFFVLRDVLFPFLLLILCKQIFLKKSSIIIEKSINLFFLCLSRADYFLFLSFLLYVNKFSCNKVPYYINKI